MASRPLILTCYFIIFSQSVTAADSSSDEYDYLLDLSFEELQNIHVSSPTRTPVSLHQAPASVTTFTRQEIDKMGVDFLFELLSYIPGFQTARNNDFSANYLYSSRGSDTAQETTGILFMVDGVPRQEIRNASASTLSSLFPVARIERIEVIRGPGSALYGSGAYQGVINIITVSGHNELKLQLGDFDQQALQTQLSAQKDNWSFDAFLSGYKDNGDQYTLDDRLGTLPKNTSDPQSVENYAFSIGHQRTRLSVDYFAVSSDDFYSIGVINNDLNKQKNEQFILSLEQGYQWGASDSQLRISYNKNKLQYLAQATNEGQLAGISNPSSDDILIGDIQYSAHQWTLQWLNNWTINRLTSIQWGAEALREEITEARILSNFDTTMLANQDFPVTYRAQADIDNQISDTLARDHVGMYAQVQHHFSPNLLFTLGGRLDDYAGIDPQFSLRAAVVGLLNDANSLKLIYGEAFRAPSLLQLDTTENVTEAPNPDLTAETIQTTELVWLSQYRAFSFSTSLFYNHIDNRIDASGFIGDRQSTVNQDSEYSSGVELESSFQVSPNWLWRASFTNTWKLPESAIGESQRTATLITNYQSDQWWVNFSGYYNSARESSDPIDITVKDFFMLNAKTGYKLRNGVTLSLQIKNLLDEDAGSIPQRLGIINPIPYRGREASISIKTSF